MPITSRIAGTGRHVPPFEYNSAEIATFAGNPRNWDGGKVAKLTGINNRRFSIRMNTNNGLPINPERDLGLAEIEMSVDAGKKALMDAGYEATAVDMLIFVSCTAQNGAREHFAASTHLIHSRLGLRPDAKALEMDAGCGGALHAIDYALESIDSGRRSVVLVIAANQPSQYMNRALYLETEAWLSSLIFGDGAAAVVLDNKANGAGIIDCVAAVDPDLELMQMRKGKASCNRAYHICGKEVRQAFGPYLGRALDSLFENVPEARDADVFIFHQVNAKVLSAFVESYGLPPDRVPINVNTRGNIAAAATLDILDEQRKAGAIGEGSLVVIGVVGAGTQYGALAARL